MHSYVRVKQTHFKTQNFLKKLFHFPPVLYIGQSIVQTFTQTTMELGRTHLINPFGRRQAVFKNLFTNLEKRGNKESWTTCSTTFSVTPLETRLWYLSSLLKKRTVFFFTPPTLKLDFRQTEEHLEARSPYSLREYLLAPWQSRGKSSCHSCQIFKLRHAFISTHFLFYWDRDGSSW